MRFSGVLGVVGGLVLDRWDMAGLTVEPGVVVPVHPLGGGDLDSAQRLPRVVGPDRSGGPLFLPMSLSKDLRVESLPKSS